MDENKKDPLKEATKIAESTKKLMDEMTKPIRDIQEQISKSAMPDIFDKIKSPMDLMPALSVPRVDYSLKIPTQEEANYYQSAGNLIKRLDNTITQWKAKIPENYEPSILAILNSGIIIDVQSLTEESFHLIRIEGFAKIDDNITPCVLFTHQSSVQMFCYPKLIEEGEERKDIGFIYRDKEPDDKE